MTPKISIVMPVYNVEPWLRECLDSVRAQTCTDWECICVDDGSTDDSPAILDEYASKDPRFQIFRRKHSNAGAVRNFGMTKASGEYLMFLDSDDVFSPWMFETLVSKAEETGADIVACSFEWFVDGDPVPCFTQPRDIFWEDRTRDESLSRKTLLVGNMPWNKVIRASFVRGNALHFLEQPSTNDATFMLLALILSDKTFFADIPLIGYRQRACSIQAGKSKNPLDYLRAMQAVEGGLRIHGVWNDLSERGRYEWFKFLSKSAIWQLETQTTSSGYRILYKGLRDNESSVGFARVFPPNVFETPEPYFLSRYRAIAENGFRERLFAFCESLLAPLAGNANRETGIRLRLARSTKHFMKALFLSKKVPWNR